METLKTDNFVFPDKIPGYLSRDEGRLLFQLAQENKKLGFVVELGSAVGKSTICLSQGVRSVDKWEMVYSVDSFDINGFDIYPDFRRNIIKYNALVYTTRQDFVRVTNYLRIPIRLLFINGRTSTKM